MYRYTDFDDAFVRGRVAEFREQVEARISGALTEDQFKPLRLMNGLYLQLHAYMLRVAVPYGTLDSRQMRRLADIADRWDRGYGHFTTRQNIQFNWPKLRDVPDILEALAEVEMHAIQTSGNCIRNVTADHFAGAAADEIEDPRPTAELIRQWSTDHPEFTWLGRKFKIGITGSPNDRAVTKAHDIGLRMVRSASGEPGYEVIVGGGLGRTPMIGKVIRDFLPKELLLPYLEAILQVYNLHGRRDNKYKARIKILVHEAGIEEIRARVEAAFAEKLARFRGVNPEVLANIEAAFAPPVFEPAPEAGPVPPLDPGLRSWIDTNVAPHREAHYAIVSISLKAVGATPGDASSEQMRVMADLAERYGHDELARQPRAERDPAACAAGASGGDLPRVEGGGARHGEYRAGLRHHRLPGHGLLRAGDRALDPGGAEDRRALRRIEARARYRAAQDQDLGLHQCLRAPSCRPYRHSRPRPGRGGELPDHPRRRRDRDGGDRRAGRAGLCL